MGIITKSVFVRFEVCALYFSFNAVCDLISQFCQT